MVAAQQSLNTPATNTRPLTPVNPSQHVVSTSSDLISAIAYNLPPNYFEESDPNHGYRWFGVSQRSSFRTEIYLNAAKRRINISVFDNKGKTIKPWSSTLRMTGNQVSDPKHDFHWFCQSHKTGFKARIHSTLHNAKISISIFDRKGETVKEWSGDIQMVADWRTRLRRAAGEALVLVHQLRNCPVCHSAMEIRKRHHDQKQFFGCSKYPKCIGTMSITDYDVTKKKAASYPANQSNENHSSI